MDNIEITTRHEKTDFGDVWYYNDNSGIFRFAIYRYDDDVDTIYLSNVFVNKEYRKNGYGNAILNAVDNIAKEMRANAICLKVLKNSFPYEWYKKHGYSDLTVDKTEPKFIWMIKYD